MPTIPLDRKLVNILRPLAKATPEGPKRDKITKEYQDIRSRVLDTEFGRTLDSLFSVFSKVPAQRTKPSFEQLDKALMEFRSRGFAEVASFMFNYWREVAATQTLEHVVVIVPDAASFELWRKAASLPAKDIEARLLADPLRTYETAGADWILLHAKPDRAASLLELFLGRKGRPKILPSALDALVLALKKDKRGALLEWILRHQWSDKGALATLAEVLRSNRSLIKSSADHLPVILCKKDAPEQGAILVEELFAMLPNTQGGEREFLTAALARLGCGILLQDRRGPQPDAVLAVIGNVVRRLRNLTQTEELQARTWVFENLSADSERPSGKAHVTAEGARHLAMAFEKAAQGFAAKDILSATVRNLGLTAIGAKGEITSYNPLQHEDLEGGMLPGDSALIEDPGWALGSDVVMRSKVKKGANHV